MVIFILQGHFFKMLPVMLLVLKNYLLTQNNIIIILKKKKYIQTDKILFFWETLSFKDIFYTILILFFIFVFVQFFCVLVL